MEKVAAIDIGSNAIRYSVAQMEPRDGYKVLQRERLSLRLGKDAFLYGNFSEYSLSKAEEAFVQIREQLDAHNVDYIRAIATSACREASNSSELCRRIFDKTGIVIHVIDGLHEAKLILRAVRSQVDLHEGNFLLVDVGGGSIELTAIEKGHILESQSFDLGTVRILNLMERGEDEWQKYLSPVKEKIGLFLNGCFHGRPENVKLVGTGGNARRLGKLKKRFMGESLSTQIELDQLKQLHADLAALTPAGRVRNYGLKFDRAEVIVPAAEIFILVASFFNTRDILLPKVGLIHGIFEDILRDEY